MLHNCQSVRAWSIGQDSRAAGHFYLTNKSNDNFSHGAILTLSKIIKHVMTSSLEAETAALFYNCKATGPLRVNLAEMGHPKPKTKVVIDNATAQGLITKSMTPKAAKLYSMQFNYRKCRQVQCLFDFIWHKGAQNRADYFTKRHPVKYYMAKQHEYVVDIPLPKE